MDFPTHSTTLTPDIHFQLSLLRMMSPGERPSQEIEEVEQLVSRALTMSGPAR